jgi:hypothetical protein
MVTFLPNSLPLSSNETKCDMLKRGVGLVSVTAEQLRKGGTEGAISRVKGGDRWPAIKIE